MSELDSLAALASRGEALWRYLQSSGPLWRSRPFTDPQPPWVGTLDGLTGWLDALPHDEIDALDSGRMPLQELHPTLAAIQHESAELCRVPHLSNPVPSRGEWRVPGRKLQQIVSFGQGCREGADACARVVEWCAGKGHLGRNLGRDLGVPVELLELNGELASSARELARRAGVDLTFTQVDVLGDVVARLDVDDLVVGLHACGELGLKMLDDCVAAGVRHFALAPCCYHRISDLAAKVQPRSNTLAALGVTFEHSMLRLSTADEVVAPGRTRRRRIHGNGYRLGLDNLLRQALGQDVYTPLGTVLADELSGSFETFCRRVAERLNLQLPDSWSPEVSERAGHERARIARARGMLRAQFRRPIELLVVIDRALSLAEMGLDVDVNTFCGREVTPRNLLIRARQGGGKARH